ncbi:MAG: hypothetical protein H6705_17930 [Myxococcales bacterium]|nr:hypothetical protein [Myxococcales bacterium]
MRPAPRAQYASPMRLLAPALALLAAAPAAASAPDLFGYGARGQGLAGAIVSDPRDHAAVYYNPAALAFEVRPGVALGYQFAAFDLRIDGRAQATRDATATVIGFDLPLPLGGPLAERVALGGGFVIPTNSVLVADIPRPGEPTFALVANRAQTVTLQAAIGVRPLDDLAIGAGFIALSALDGAIDVAPNAEGRIGSQARDQLVADYAPVFALAARLPAGFAVGAVWRGESAARFELPITADLGDRFPLPIPTLQIEGTAQYDPAQLAGEVGWRRDAWRLAAGATWKRWSAFPAPIAYTAVPEGFPAQPGPGYDDAFEYRGGLEWTPSTEAVRFAARAGYQFAASPAPEQRGLHALLDSDRHLVALGGGVAWDRLRLDVAVQWHHLVERSHRKDPAAIAAAGYDPKDHPGLPSLSHSGDIVGFAVELGVEL